MKKCYKIFDKNLVCRDTPFFVGGTFSYIGEIKLCKSGFHFHQDPKDLFNYYSFDPQNRVCEILHGPNVIHGDDKSVTDIMHIVKELSWHKVLDLVNVGKGNSGHSNTGHSNTGNRNSGNRNTGHSNSGHDNTGNRNTGHYNSGHYNSGNDNSGDDNSGNYNSGHYNSGRYNSGNDNSGNYNSGNDNSGNYNSGHHNSGHHNSGHYNSGHYNSGYHNSGIFNTMEQTVFAFNKDTGILRKDLSVPHVNLILFDKKTKQKIDYEQAWENAWSKLDETQKKQFYNLPNFDADIFKEITGIEVRP